MRIIRIIDDPNPKRNKSFSDYLTVEVEYKDGNIGNAMFTRAKVDRYNFQQKLKKQYNIPEKALEDFIELCINEERAERIWDECD